MRRAPLAAGLVLAVAGPLAAQQAPSQLDLVRALRQAGLVDLAVQRLEELKAKKGLLTPAEEQLVPLELARIRLEEASRETEDARRTTLVGQAKASFDEFIKNNPTHPMAAQANVEIARLYALQAKGQLSKGNRLEGEAKAQVFAQARPDFTTAINRYKGAVTNLENRLKGLDEKDPLAAELKRSKAQAELDAAVLQYEMGLTFVGDDERAKKADAIEKAQKDFDKLADKYSNDRVGYLAQVWSWQCSFVNGDAAKAVPAMDKFATANRQNREAAEAVRRAGFFAIEHAMEADTGKDTSPAAQFQRAERAAERWLQTYPEAKNTPEGLGARYRRALMKEAQVLRVPGMVIFENPPKAKAPATPPKTPAPKDPKEPKAAAKEPKEPAKEPAPVQRKIIGLAGGAKPLLEDANKIYRELTETDNEYSERAHRHRLTNQLIILEAEGKGGDPPDKAVNTLEQAYLAAQVQQAKIYQLSTSTKSEEEKEKEEKQRVNRAIGYLERGLTRVTPRDTPRDVFDARMLMVQLLTRNERAVEAAVLGEGLARANPKLSKAPVAAALAVFAYNSALGKLKQAGGPEDAQEADVKRIMALAEFADKTWPNDGPTDAIRHVLAFYQDKKDHALAWQTYSKIGGGYTEVYQARREMAAAMFYMLRPEEKDPKKYREAVEANVKKYSQQFQTTLAMLEALPEPASGAPAHQAEAWAGAKTMLAQLRYMNAEYDKVDGVVKTIVEGLKKLTGLEEKKRDDLAATARALRFNALQGRAAEFIKAKEYAKVGEDLGPEIEALKKELKTPPAAEESPGLGRLKKAQRDFLIAAMSAFVQNKQVDQASEMLDALQGTGGTLESNLAVMQQLNGSIQGQISSLLKDGKREEAGELAKSFTEFLDKIKGDDANLGKLPNGVVLFLGQGYSAVGQHARAADLFDQLIKKPFEPNPKASPDEQKKAETDHANTVRQLEYLQARTLRQAGGKENFAKATALMQKIVGDPVAKKGPPQGWGYRNLAIRKEYVALLEDQQQFAPAMNNWKRLIQEYVPGNGPPAPIKFLGQRPVFGAFGQAADAALSGAFLVPFPVAAWVDAGFKGVYPGLAEKRGQQRALYFDLFVEAQRCSARAYTELAAKVKDLPEKMANIGQSLYLLTSKNEDVPPDVLEKVKEILEKYPLVKKKYDELAAAAPKTGG